jgi:MoxR-like ATPase
MQERQVTTEGTTRQLPRPFLVIATQNPIEYEGTYPLPEAQLDRFLVRLRVGYPSSDEEEAILRARIERAADEVQLQPVVEAAELSAMQAGVERVFVAESVTRYMVALVEATRASARLQVGASPRGTLALLKLSRAHAVMDGRDYVVPDDVKAVAVPALAHRLILRPELWVQRVRAEQVVEECLASVPAPSAEESAPAQS